MIPSDDGRHGSFARRSIRVDADALDAAADALRRDLEHTFGPSYVQVSAAFGPASRLSTVDGTPLIEFATVSGQLGEYMRLAEAALADLRVGSAAIVAGAREVARAYRDSDAAGAANVRAVSDAGARDPSVVPAGPASGSPAVGR